jgi:predicted  nucleic acid-binding Zn-ribbon protein
VSDPFELLLEVQDDDTAIDQLRHRRATLAARAELADTEKRLAELGSRAATLGAERDVLGARQADLEGQIESSRSRRGEIEKRMFGGQVSAARDLQAMDDEVKHLARHVTELEDREIEVMEALEPLDEELASLAGERTASEESATRLRGVVAGEEAATDEEIAALEARREQAAAGVPAELLAKYESLRAKLGGTGAARLVGGSCSGCHLVLSSMEVDRIRKAPPDMLITCEQCGRILVR